VRVALHFLQFALPAEPEIWSKKQETQNEISDHKPKNDCEQDLTSYVWGVFEERFFL